MSSLTIRVARSTHAGLQEVSRETGKTIGEVVEEALTAYRAKKYWADMKSAYEALHAAPGAFEDYIRESAAWDCTLADGLEGDRW